MEGNIGRRMEKQGGRFFMVIFFSCLDYWAARWRIPLHQWLSRIVVVRSKDRYEGLMPRANEKRRGPSCRTKWHIKVKMHLGKGTFCCNTLNLCCRTAPKVGAGNLKGMSSSWAKWEEQGQERGKLEKKNL